MNDLLKTKRSYGRKRAIAKKAMAIKQINVNESYIFSCHRTHFLDMNNTSECEGSVVSTLS